MDKEMKLMLLTAATTVMVTGAFTLVLGGGDPWKAGAVMLESFVVLFVVYIIYSFYEWLFNEDDHARP